MRRLIIGLLAAAALFGGGLVMVDASVQCGGSFVPTLACTIPGLWNFTNPTTVLSPNPVPFQVGGVDATGVISAIVDLNNTQVLALDRTGITIIPAPGTGKSIDVVGVTLAFNYTGAYTVGGGDDLKLYYGSRIGGNAASASIETNGFLTATADIAIRVAGTPDNTNPSVSNQAVVLMNTSGVAFGGGNAANSLRVIANYRIVSTGL